MLRGLTTVTQFVDDVPRAIAWYTELLDLDPYFIRPSAEDPAYAEFRIGDSLDELGLIDARYRPAGIDATKPAGAVTYWHVDDVAAAAQRVQELGGSILEGPLERGDEGWVTAVAADPFGNLFGLMHSPHYLETLEQ